MITYLIFVFRVSFLSDVDSKLMIVSFRNQTLMYIAWTNYSPKAAVKMN